MATRTVSWGLDGGLEYYLSTTRPLPMLALYGVGDLEKKIAGLIQQCRKQYGGMGCGFKHVEAGDVMPKKKEKKSYDGYIPQGVLKADWCRKHQEDVFGCVLMVLDMDQSASKEIFESSAEAIVDKLKQQLKGRQTKILMVVTTSADKLPYYDKPETCQTTLRKKCDLEANKNVALLHLSLGTTEGVKRVLQAATEFSNQYYKDEAKKVKKLKESAHRTLQPRHRFKVAYYFEIRGQTDLALRYYGQCYDYIRALSPDQFSISEIKTVAEIVMFRTCLLRLLYDEGTRTSPAIKIFKDHMSWYRDAEHSFTKPAAKGKTSLGGDGSVSSPLRRYGAASVTSGDRDQVSQSSGGQGFFGSEVASVAATPSAILLHHIAVARQHEHFAELLRETRATPDTDHYTAPYHYHAAAAAVLQRRAYAKRAASSSERMGGSFSTPVRPPYVGKPWGGSEDSYLQKLLEHEEEVPYEEEAIVLCMKAKSCTPEAHQHVHHTLSVMIARCHVDLERWDQAKAELQGVYKHFSETGEWPGMAEVVLKLLMECGVKNEVLGEYLEAALRYAYLSGKGAGIYRDTVRWLKGECVDNLERSLTRPDSPPVVEVDLSHPFLSTMVQFKKPMVHVHVQTVVKVRLATKAPFPVAVNRVEVLFHQDGTSLSLDVAATITKDGPRVFEIPVTFKEATIVKVKELRVHVEDGVLVIARPIGQCADLINRLTTETEPYPDYAEARVPSQGYGLLGSSFLDRPAVKILKSEPNMVVTLRHDPPALLDEPYPIEVIAAAGEEEVLTGSITVRGSPDYTIVDAYREAGEEVAGVDETSPELFEGSGAKIVDKKYSMAGGIPAGGVWKLTVVVKFKSCGRHTVPVDVVHTTEKGVGQFAVVKRAEVSAEIPFGMAVQVADSVKWTQGGLPATVPNPYCTSGYYLTANVPHNEFSNASFNSTSHAARQHAEELTKLGVATPTVPYAVKIKKFPVMTPMRLKQVAMLTVTISCTVKEYQLEVRGIHPNPVKGMKLVSEQPFEPTELSKGEELSTTWLVEPTSTPEMKCHIVVTARRAGSSYPCIPFTIDVPPIPVVDPPIVLDYLIPDDSSIGEVLPLSVNLRNTSKDTVRHVTCEVSDLSPEMESRFLWSGKSSWACSIPPVSTATIEYKLIPVFPGVLSLPSMSVKMGDKSIVEPHETASIYISPKNSAFTKCA